MTERQGFGDLKLFEKSLTYLKQYDIVFPFKEQKDKYGNKKYNNCRYNE